ncbi:unnamed protein product [Cuscuta europaea]|uniref:Uncharacterized protein n=1 Tax=Cuscuta europaea TaxID=41803 RepID=A0A9P0ZGX3_CUSEU|nr:unnamed protein product [Cuscuta europaea]
MGSNVLSQVSLINFPVLFVVPKNPTQWGPKRPGFSSFFRPSELNSFATDLSRVSPNSIHSSFSKRGKQPFVVRADEEGADGVSEAPVAVEAAPESGSETESESQMDAAAKEEKPPRKPRIKLGDIMGILNNRAVEAADNERHVPDLRTGDIVEIKLEVPENRKRLSVYKGIVMSKQNAGIHTTIRIRRIIAGVGVEIVFPIYSPNIKEIKVVKHRKVRRARLYYLRDKLPRLSTFK